MSCEPPKDAFEMPPARPDDPVFRFSRAEAAGSLGDLGTLLPIAIGMIMINKLEPVGMFLSIGLFYILAGLYFRIPVPVQPMKVVGAYAIATAMSAQQIWASGLILGLILLVIGATGFITLIQRAIAKSVIRGVQLSTGVLLMVKGVEFILGTSAFQAMAKGGEPFLSIQFLGPVPLGIVIGVAAGAATLLLLDNKKLPAALVVVLGGMLAGLFLGTRAGISRISPGFHLPGFFPFGFPVSMDFIAAFFTLVLPQIPMTLGNAVIANADLSETYFKERSKKVTPKALCVSMALANFVSAVLGGMPLCHGAGGLAAHYRFGARTAGSNLIIGAVFVLLAIGLGTGILAVIYLIPMAVLGVLLLFAGTKLAMAILDLTAEKDLFVAMVMLGFTLTLNLAVAFGVGICLAWLLQWGKIRV